MSAGEPIRAIRRTPVTPTSPTAIPPHRKRIMRSEYLQVGSLDPAQRAALVDRLYAVYSETVRGATRDEFESQVFGTPEVRLALFYAVRDELAGFSYSGIERVGHAGRTHAVFSAGGFFRPGYHGGVLSLFFGLGQALRFKIREPRSPLGYLTRSSTPAVYRLVASMIPRIYPSRRHQTPAEVEALVRAISVRRRYVPVGEGPWVVRSEAAPRDPSRLRRLERDPDVRFYVELNPRFAEGEGCCCWCSNDCSAGRRILCAASGWPLSGRRCSGRLGWV